ncbi:MAG TPA: glutamyl-tRNA reductase [Dermatophilaceae bacterium]|nr:glutamyl-tRNA reductase [Dermatophilaceae bacterium]
MSVVVLGLSHRSAPIALLEAVALDPAGAAALAVTVRRGENVTESLVLATCNRIEVYADVLTFHGAVAEISDALAAASGVPLAELREHLYVHYEDRAVSHLFSVACGLESMAVGEGQILGQLRMALRSAQQRGQAGGTLSALFQQALRVGKRAHAETGIDRVSKSLVDAGLVRAADLLGPLSDTRVLVVGAGSMSSLAATTISRLGAAELVIINRTLVKAERLAAATGGFALPLADLEVALSRADLVISCTGALGHVITPETLAAAAATATAGGGTTGPRMFIDLGLPRNVAPEVADLPGEYVVGLTELDEILANDSQHAPHVKAVGDLVVAEVAAYLVRRRAQEVAPTVALLRSRAADVVTAELSRLSQRLPDDLSDDARTEIRLAVHRVVEKLLHAPTVRAKSLVAGGEGGDYARALRELFDLDPHEVAAVSVPSENGGLV